MTVDITEIIVNVLGLLVTIATVFIIPYIKKNLTKQERDNLAYWVEVAVLAAEGMFTNTKLGKEKYEYVINFLHSKGLKFNEDEVKVLIESAVYELINQFKERESEMDKIGGTD